MHYTASPDFVELVQDTLATFEDRLVQAAIADSPFVTEAANHIISAGGKRFRPLLVILASELGGEADREKLLNASLVIELTHVASLYHDDVMDDADLRRGAPSANRKWGNSIAILVGDFLFSKASSLVADLGADFLKLQARTFSRLVQGQIAETRGPGPDDDPLQHYLQVVSDKTGSLIASSAVFGGMVAGLPQEVLDTLADFGEEIGVIFQLSDDLMDITSDRSGKRPGTDLREKVPTLPILMLRARNDPADQELIARLDGDLTDDGTLGEVLTQLRAHPVIEEARDEVRRRTEVARGYLTPLPECEAKNALSEICTDLVERAS